MRAFWFIIILLAVIIGLFFVLKPKSQQIFQTASPQSSSLSTHGQTKLFTLVVKNKKLVSGPETLTVSEGDTVTIAITNDETEELHLHGYDKKIDLEPNTQAQLNFVADKTGRFEYELEHSGTPIGALEVQPK